MTRELPGVKVQPVVRNLNLVSVNDLLLEDTISVAETVAPSRVVEGGQTIQEAGGQTTETAITKSSIVLLLDYVFDSEAKVLQASCEIAY